MCCNDGTEPQVNVDVRVDVPKIVKYACLAGVLIIGIIFGTRAYIKLAEISKHQNK